MLHINNHLRSVIPIIFLLTLGYACKTARPDASDNLHELTILLEGETSPGDLAEIRKYEVEKMSRASRSQNLWIVKIRSTLGTSEIISAIESAEQVLKVDKVDKSGEAPSNSTNVKKGKTNPIKNDN